MCSIGMEQEHMLTHPLLLVFFCAYELLYHLPGTSCCTMAFHEDAYSNMFDGVMVGCFACIKLSISQKYIRYLEF